VAQLEVAIRIIEEGVNKVDETLHTLGLGLRNPNSWSSARKTETFAKKTKKKRM
jgi:hypothetical protein